ncbi:helix-turn-helix domain-containing protein [Mangrovimonas aestuarii]|uniref:helix-turn-helix domain-containing protein n=1 Tax=Mangrovimonas aestuarii TaxID=3018443 RepID=UPI0023796882|nr:helix-turn-helix transcriptional regulator [Mangrovimonas aestuarii]
MEEEYIRLIFGLKLKQLRSEKKLSLFGLSKLTGLSKSYLNEIEKGKKYPKTDKIVLLAEALDTPYDQMVSIKLDKNLAPLGEILHSKILKEIPLDLFGIQENDLIDIISNAPAKVNAFVSTIIKIAQNYNVSKEHFFLASLRSYQEANNNYFEEIESQVEAFTKAYQIGFNPPITSKDLEEILVEENGYTIDETELSNEEALTSLRSVFVPSSKTLLLNDSITEAQRTFIYAKELAFNFLNIEQRPYSFPWIEFKSFDEVLNNFYASYFAGALIIPRKDLIPKLESFFDSENFSENDFLKIMNSYKCSPETFYQRLTNILPKDFNMKNLFFLRFKHRIGSESFHLKKELHITHQQSPQANEMNEHYCRRWISIKTLQRIEETQAKHLFDLQISDYGEDSNQYLVLSSATEDPFNANHYRSISIGFLITQHLKNKVKFVNDQRISRLSVGVTCETCPIENCEVRAAEPIQLEKIAKHNFTSTAVDTLLKRFLEQPKKQ